MHQNQTQNPEPETRGEALEGLGDGRWAVRLACARWRYAQGDADARRALAPLTRDPKREVRQFATFAVGWPGEGQAVPDAVALLMERALDDPSPRVRRTAIQVLAYGHAHPDLRGFFQGLLDAETDPKLHRLAGIGLWLSGRDAS